jgi:hypothetical protein
MQKKYNFINIRKPLHKLTKYIIIIDCIEKNQKLKLEN